MGRRRRGGEEEESVGRSEEGKDSETGRDGKLGIVADSKHSTQLALTSKAEWHYETNWVVYHYASTSTTHHDNMWTTDS